MIRTFFIRLFVIALVVCTAVSCKKGDDPTPVSCLLTSQTTSAGITYTFTYEGTILRSQSTILSGAILVATYEYDDSGKLVKLANSVGPSSRLIYTGDLITAQERYSGNVVTGKTEYEYTGDQLTKIQEYHDFGSGFEKSEYRTFEYSGNTNNMVRVKQFNQGSLTPASIAEYTYGDKKSALGAALPEILKLNRLGGLPIESNVLKIVFNTGEEITYTYEFNEQGFPTKRTETYKSGQVNVQTNTYACN